MTAARIVIDRAVFRTSARPGCWQVTLNLPGERRAEYLERWEAVADARADAARLAKLTGATIEDRSSGAARR